MTNVSKGEQSRRKFLQTTTIGCGATLLAPAIVTAKKSGTSTIVGTEEHRYVVVDAWPQLPSKYSWQTTHNVAVDSEGLIYVIHEGRLDQVEHPSIFVFDPAGKFVRAFGSQFQGGGHGIEVRNEGGQDFIYVCAYQQQRSFAKLDTRGEQVWRRGAPMESGIYAEGEDRFPRAKDNNPWGLDRFNPTNIAFLDDGGFFVIDGYGAYRIHRYDAEANWTSMFGEPGVDDDRSDGKFHLPHGIWIDRRGEEPLVVVADRVFNRLQWFTLDGEHQRTQDGFLLPANIDTMGDLMIVPELYGRTTLLDRDNQVIAHLGDNSAKIQADLQFKTRKMESTWETGKFIHPHDACFDAEGNIFVAEWVKRGRVTKLQRIA